MIIKSLRSQLLLWLLGPLALAGMLDGLTTYQAGEDTATLLQDRLLLGSARSIAEQVGVVDARLDVRVPPAALELLDSGHEDRVYYRVGEVHGRLLSGDGELDTPPAPPDPLEWVAFDTTVRGQPVRAVAFFQPVFGAPTRGPVAIVVAQTMRARNLLARQMWYHAVRQQLVMLALVALLLGLGLRRGVSPLIALRDRMRRRQPGALERIDENSVPSELRPLVSALNEYVIRLDHHVLVQSQFIADASHQLRTPLTVLNTQLAYAKRNSGGTPKDEALDAMRSTLQSTIRLVNQLLAFAEVDGIRHPPELQRVDLCAQAHEVIEDLALLARTRHIDLGFESSARCLFVRANIHTLGALIANLVDNSLRYTQENGVVTVAVTATPEGGALLTVTDNGPGIPEQERERVFARFYRLSTTELDGCGLGLPIVRGIASACDATVTLHTAPGGGLVVAVAFPADLAPTRQGQRAASAPSPHTGQGAISAVDSPAG